MSRLNSLFAAAVLVATVALAPQSQAVTQKAIIAGSSAMWQSMALAAYNGNGTQGNCITGMTAPCFHYTAKGFNLNDTRPVSKGGTALVDSNAIWIVWDSAATTNMIAYIKVDSVVGLRCYFAHPHCNINVTTFPAPGNLIANSVWGDNNGDATPPATVQALFTAATGPLVTVGASDIRPEDGLFAMCRANSALDNVNYAGLGYNSNNTTPGACTTGTTLANLVGTDITGVVSTSTAHVAAFKISGTDPFSGLAIPAFTTVSAGADPIVFVAKVNNNSVLANVTNLTDSQLQTVFSGVSCLGTDLGGTSGPIDAFLREPLSGTMNTTEATVFRYPNASGHSQESNIDPSLPNNNPLNLPCLAGGSGSRKRGIGTGDVIKGVSTSTTNDSITYAFFSYGNVSSLADSASFRYFTLNGVDPIFHKYVSSPGGTAIDPAQPNASIGDIPGSGADLVAAGCANGFPCPETKIWSGNLSFPNLRSGQYRAWSFVRLVSDGAALATAKTLVSKSQAFVASSTPDFVPALPVLAAPTAVPPVPADPGLPLLRSHYTQEGVSPINQSATGDKGGDMGGCILHALPGTTTAILAQTDTTVKLAQAAPGSECVIVP